jgi:hypothetical protein
MLLFSGAVPSAPISLKELDSLKELGREENLPSIAKAGQESSLARVPRFTIFVHHVGVARRAVIERIL